MQLVRVLRLRGRHDDTGSGHHSSSSSQRFSEASHLARAVNSEPDHQPGLRLPLYLLLLEMIDALS